MTEAADMYVTFITSSYLFLYVSEFLHNKNVKQKKSLRERLCFVSQYLMHPQHEVGAQY